MLHPGYIHCKWSDHDLRLASSARILAPHLPTSPAHLPAPALAGRKVWEIRTGAIAYSRRPLHCCWTDADAADGWTRGELPSRRRRRRHHPLIAAPSRQLNSRLRARRARATNWIHLFPFSSNCNCSSNLQPKRGKSFADRLRHMAMAIQGDRTRCPQGTEKWTEWASLTSVAHSAHYSVSFGHPVRSPCKQCCNLGQIFNFA